MKRRTGMWFAVIVLLVLGVAGIGGFLALRMLPVVTMPHNSGFEMSTPIPATTPGVIEGPTATPLEETEQATRMPETVYPVEFGSMGAVHSAEMRYGTFAVATYAWDFGDGTTSDQENPTHVYQAPGTYLVQLTLTSKDGKTYTESREVTVDG